MSRFTSFIICPCCDTPMSEVENGFWHCANCDTRVDAGYASTPYAYTKQKEDDEEFYHTDHA